MNTSESPDRAVFPHHLYNEGPTRIIPFDLSEQLGCPGSATSRGLCASFIRILAGESLQTQPNAASEVYYVIRGHGRTCLVSRELPWEQGDFFALPAGIGAEHHAQADSAFFRILDEPLLRYLTETKLLWWRPRRAGRPPRKRKSGAARPASRRPRQRTRSSAGKPSDSAALPSPSTPHPLQRRRKRGLPILVLAAILCGLLLAWGARRSIGARSQAEGDGARSASAGPRARPVSEGKNLADAAGPAGAFRVGGRSFVTLAEALGAAGDGDTITIAGEGPYRVGPLLCRARTLTLRAQKGSRPCLELVGGGEPLLSADRPLTLEGIELRHAAGEKESGFLVCCEGGALHLRHCRLYPGARALAVLCRGCSEVTVQSCAIRGGMVGISAQVTGQSCRLQMGDSRIETADPAGAALSLWASETGDPAAAALALERSELRAGRIVALRRLLGGVRIEARSSRFHCREALLSCAGYGSPRGGLQQVEWSGSGNVVEAAGDWLSLEGVPAGVRNEHGWNALWRRRPAGLNEVLLPPG